MGGLEDRDRPQLLSFKSNTDFIKHLLVLKKREEQISRDVFTLHSLAMKTYMTIFAFFVTFLYHNYPYTLL